MLRQSTYTTSIQLICSTLCLILSVCPSVCQILRQSTYTTSSQVIYSTLCLILSVCMFVFLSVYLSVKCCVNLHTPCRFKFFSSHFFCRSVSLSVPVFMSVFFLSVCPMLFQSTHTKYATYLQQSLSTFGCLFDCPCFVCYYVCWGVCLRKFLLAYPPNVFLQFLTFKIN